MDTKATQDIADLQQLVKGLRADIEALQQRRIGQQDIINQAVKNRALGEPNSYIFTGLAANKPTKGVKLTTTGLGCSLYWAYDTHVLYIWDGTVWRSQTLT